MPFSKNDPVKETAGGRTDGLSTTPAEATPPNSSGPSHQAAPASELEEQVSSLRQKLQVAQENFAQAQEREKRLLADYQNLQRHTREERTALIKMANKDFCLELLQPLEHLNLATTQLNDPGLNMVTEQLWKKLAEMGLEIIPVLNKKFDLETMEVVDKQNKGEKVVKIVRNGYRLNGQVIQHAQVILG